MLNGATMRLRKIQARSARLRKKRRVDPNPSGSAFSSGAFTGIATGEQGSHSQRLSGPSCEVKPGWRFAAPPSCGSVNGERNADQDQLKQLNELFSAEPDRLSRLTFEVGSLFDWSKTHVILGSWKNFKSGFGLETSKRRGEALSSGEIVESERRPGRDPCRGTGQRSAGGRRSGAARGASGCALLVDAIEGGAFGDVTGVLHIGIGGSVLGPALVIDALGRNRARPDVRFLSNIDGAAFDEATSELDPATTLDCRRLEDLPDGRRRSPISRRRCDGCATPASRIRTARSSPSPPSRKPRSRPASTRPASCRFGEGVGGRYSLWSSVGVSAALALGWDAFEELLEGAAEMDRHFRFADAAANVPLLAAFADRFYRQAACQTRAVFPYDERLRLLPVLSAAARDGIERQVGRRDGEAGRAADRAGHLGRGRHRCAARRVPAAAPGHRYLPVEFIAVIEQRRRRRTRRTIACLAPQCLRPGRGADGRRQERRSPSRLSRRTGRRDDPPRPARPRASAR